MKKKYEPELRSIPLTRFDCPDLKSRVTRMFTNRFGEVKHTEFATVEPCCQHKKYPYVMFNGQRDPLYCRVACESGKCPNGVMV
jgi:hypothetical protein